MVKPPTRATYRSLREITANSSNFDVAHPNIELKCLYLLKIYRKA